MPVATDFGAVVGQVPSTLGRGSGRASAVNGSGRGVSDATGDPGESAKRQC